MVCQAKNCPECGSFSFGKYGRQNGRQRFRCKDCGRYFRSGKRPSVRARLAWKAYASGRRVVAELSSSDGRSERQVRRVLAAESERHAPAVVPPDRAGPVALAVDTAYFGTFGVMVFRCAVRRQNLLWKFVGSETNEDYLAGIRELRDAGWEIAAVVCDGKRWLAGRISELGIPAQLCQFHCVKTVTRHLTRRPRTEAGRSLRALALTLASSDEASFAAALAAWHAEWGGFLTERAVDAGTGRRRYAHRNVRAAYGTLSRWLPFLFTFERFPGSGIPNTTNTLDGSFSHLRGKVSVHRGLSEKTKRGMVSFLLSQPTGKKR